MELERIVEKFVSKPKYMLYGAGHLSKLWDCDREDVYTAKKQVRGSSSIIVEQVKKRLPKILIFDIESSPSISYTFGRFKTNVNWDQVEQEPIMLTWSAKFLYSADVMSDKITPEEALRADDKRIVTRLHKLMSESDIVIAHYGDRFDIPLLNARAILNGLPPYNTVNSIDTKKVASATFKFPSNKLDALAKYFGLDGKIKTEFQLWIDCLKGIPSAIEEMRVYNVQDVIALEEVYLKLRPYIKAHPNVSLYNDIQEKQCCSCGSLNVEEIEDKLYYTTTGAYAMYRCKCGAISRGRKTVLPKSKNINTLTSIGK